MHWFPQFDYILASKSPRRQQLLKSLGISFRVIIKEVDETYPGHLNKEEIPVYLAQKKSNPFVKTLSSSDLLITADTIVWLNGKMFGKPQNTEQAKTMLHELSGQKHQVISGVCLTSSQKQKCFHAVTEVTFKELTRLETAYYVSVFKPYDKAGSYGIQDWIGAIGITRIEGSFYNVMGLPIQRLYEEIQKF